MSAIQDVDIDLATFCGRIGNLYGRHGLCPPFALHAAAQGWMAREIPLSRCVDVIEHFLSRHARSCYSGSGDWNFAWLNSLIRTSWHERSFAGPPSPAPNQSRYWGDDYGADEPKSPRRKEAFSAGLLKHGSLEEDGIAPGQKGVGPVSPVRERNSASPRQIRGRKHGPSSRAQAQNPKKIDLAVALLRSELATGERPAAEVEAKALCAGICPRTYDRARHRLGVTSRRIGFGRWAKYVIALPGRHGTPSEGANMAGAT
jgi:hypothetical protein